MKTWKEFTEGARIVGKVDLAPSKSERVTKSDLNNLEKFLDRLFSSLNIDIDFTRHFLDRINDNRNKPAITTDEVRDAFQKTYKKHGKTLANLKGIEAVLNDLASKINIPFVLQWDAKNKELDLVSKTVMRKKDFKTPDRKFKV